MRKGCGGHRARPEMQTCGCTGDASADAQSSRREFLKAGAALTAGGAAAQIPPRSALAQGVGGADAETELRRLQMQRLSSSKAA